ncbi:AraC family transcriptional regulator [Hymenobacter cavernae]|uniref:Transcriptional regulator n=1 Tax=Hymenobacter cavernae TaxID=2044852 RepID=A0ABQ1TSH2_9BACT|nr:AraC family transcriptional regulator [Hymenobacter cavernae]GGF02622.1 transcriptional regulator [Hymenobacter cavernae]
MLTTAQFLQQVIDIDSRPACMFVQHARTEHNYPMHHHQKGQFVYVEEGLAYLYAPNKTYFIPARHYVWIPPLLEHRVFVQSPQHLLHSLCFAVDDDLGHPFYSTMGIYPVTTLLYEMLLFTEKWDGHICPDDHDQYLFLQTLKMILPKISQHPLPIVLPTTDDERLQPVLAYLHQNLGEPLEVAAVARRFGFSMRNLSRLFQQRMSLSFVQYLKLCRVIAAMEQMLQTSKNISEIAYSVGYNSLSAFSNTFTQLVHCRPTEFMLREHKHSKHMTRR